MAFGEDVARRKTRFPDRVFSLFRETLFPKRPGQQSGGYRDRVIPIQQRTEIMQSTVQEVVVHEKSRVTLVLAAIPEVHDSKFVSREKWERGRYPLLSTTHLRLGWCGGGGCRGTGGRPARVDIEHGRRHLKPTIRPRYLPGHAPQTGQPTTASRGRQTLRPCRSAPSPPTSGPLTG